MNDLEKTALHYFYLKAKQQLNDKNVKGMARKSCFEFVKTIRDLSYNLDNIMDLEEVLKNGG